MSKPLLFLTVAILALLPYAATAQDYPNLPAPIPPKAIPQRLSPRQVFHWLDTNHDGFLSLNEFLAAPWVKDKQRATRFFRWMDTNHDGLVSLPEFLAAYARYCSDDGYAVRVAYPWGWTCWRPWRYGWYWNSGWHRRPGGWWGYAGQHHAHGHHPHHFAKHSGRHHHPVKHARPPRPGHHGKHHGHGHGHGHGHHAHHAHH